MSTLDDRFRRKLSAFLSEPIDNVLLDTNGKERPEQRIQALRERLGLAGRTASEDARFDLMAAVMERVFVPEDARSPSFLDDPEIRHSFSGRSLTDVVDLSNVDLRGAREGVVDAIESLDLPSDDPQAAFFALWRALLPALRERSPDTLSRIWSVLPADARIPDHGAFQQRTVASAFSGIARQDGALRTDATFLLVTIGPAQAFIQESRKTQDLYWGSALLSQLTWAAMKPVAKQYGPDAIVFPDLYGQPLVDQWLESDFGLDLRGDSRSGLTSLPTLPNRFFAVVDAGDEEARRTLLGTVEDAIHEWLENLAESVLGSGVLPEESSPRSLLPAVRLHLRDALSVYGVALPLHSDEEPLTTDGVLEALGSHVDGDTLETTRRMLAVAEEDRAGSGLGLVYSLLHTVTEKMLAAQKNTRAFQQLPSNEDAREGGERGRKCGLCGERNALFYRGHPALIGHNEPQAVCVDEASAIDVAQMRDGEGLCGACFVKRFTGRTLDGPDHFPSTAEVALAPLLQGPWKSRFDQARTKLRQEVGKNGGTFDPQLFFDENLRPGYLAKYIYPDREEHEVENEAEALRETLEDHLPSDVRGQMTRYYGLLVLDGDHMGEWVAGKEAPPFGQGEESGYRGIYHSSVWARLPDALKGDLQSLPPEDEDWGRRPLTPALHATLSRALADYALEAVRPIVEEEHHGKLVYAGGDDVLAFVPLAEALDVALHLRAAFSGHRPLPPPEEHILPGERPEVNFTADVSGFRERGGRVVTTLGPEASASVGLALAHYKTPLGEVLRTAREMEERAKEAGRDRLAMAVLKRSGDRTDGTVPFRHEAVQRKRGPIGIFQDLIEALQKPGLDLSPTFIRTLQRELRPLLDEGGALWKEHPDASALVKTEIARLLRRALDATDPDRADEFVETMSDRLAMAHRAIGSTEGFLDVLDAVLFLHRETKDFNVRQTYAA